MPRSLNDHEVKFLCDAELYLAFKHLAEADDRSLSDYLRHLARCHVRQQASSFARRSSSDGPEPGQNLPDSSQTFPE